MARRGGFTLVEILIVVVILGILATIVIPQFSNAAVEARENALKDDLRYIRTQLQVFRAQHADVSAGYPGGASTAVPTEAAFVDQMTRFSNMACATSATSSATYKFGPYLSRIPENPLNNSAKIKMIPNGTAMPAPLAGEANQYGWIYKPSTSEIIANNIGNDATGTPYSKY